MRYWPKLRLLLPIHDELMLEFPDRYLKYKNDILVDISKLMVDIKGVDIRLDVEWKETRSNWGELKTIQVDY